MKPIIALLILLLATACGGDTSHKNSPMVAPVDNRTEKEVIIHQNTLSKTDALKVVDDIEVLSTKINEGKFPYKVGDKIGNYVETTTFFSDEEKTQAKMVKLIGIGGTAIVYFVNESTAVVDQNGFVYIFKGGQLAHTMTEGETITGISETNKNDISNILQTAKKVVK